jgi:hypothetical protein
VLSRPGLPKGSFTTPWRPSVPASAAPAPARGSVAADGFRLASYVTGGSHWSLTEGPAGTFNVVACPSTSACYLTFTALGPSARPGTSSFYFSSNGGSSWARLPLPSRLTFSSAQTCPSPDVCAGTAYLDATNAGGQLSGKNVLVSTVDGGHRWSVVPTPFSAPLFLLSCTSASVCNGATVSATHQEQLVRTTKAGATWSVALTLSTSSEVYALSCPNQNNCVATGAYHPVGASVPGDFALFSDNGGAHWARAGMEGRPAAGLLTALSCASAADCTAVSPYNALIPPLGTPPVGSVAGPSELYALSPSIAETVDGGKTWRVQGFDLQTLAAVGAAKGISAMVCPPEGAQPGRCWPPTAGGPEPPPTPWMAWGISASEFVVGPGALDCPALGQCALAGPWGLGLTANGGNSWTVPALPAGSFTTQGHTSVFSLSCPAPGQCVAIGFPPGSSGNSATPTPVLSSIRP